LGVTVSKTTEGLSTLIYISVRHIPCPYPRAPFGKSTDEKTGGFPILKMKIPAGVQAPVFLVLYT
jgi:hypothetical protein